MRYEVVESFEKRKFIGWSVVDTKTNETVWTYRVGTYDADTAHHIALTMAHDLEEGIK